ncbi:MAG: nitrilase-related carbon-nitrogen hydrolase [Archangium sp.]|nr:nitrilase-related carbon-nitrogen hydrolase [Archangium sp.]
MIRAALTQTINAFPDMPEDLKRLEGRLEDVRKANVDHHLALVASAKQQGVQVICFGELFPGPYFALRNDPMWLGLAEDAHTGKTVTTLRQVAQEQSMIIIAPLYELAPSGRRFNTAVVIDETGEVLGTYRKTHIPHGTNEQGSFLEGNYYERSDGGNSLGPRNVSKNPFFPVWQTSLGKLGVAICYDRHFEGVMSSLAHAGAELIFSPAVTFGAKSQRMWHLEFQVDAARHNVFIGGSNRKGVEAPWNQPYFGESHFTGPNGVLKNQSTHDELIIADVDLGELKRPDPSGWNLPRDTRLDIYTRR